ncbi:MAG: fibronectin type III domain-containing protein, partial [Bdellovibrionales bacterium]|nr:fibronectin type III domain-containing protein [Bdellovibrionales bacterium]
MNKKFTLAALLIVQVSLTGCLPEDEALPSSSGDATVRYTGFEGLESVETLSATKLKLRWTASTNPNVVGYNIYDTTLFSLPRLVKTVNAGRSEATLAGLSEGFFYNFRVRAIDSNGVEDSNMNDLVGIPYDGMTDVTVLSSTSARVTFSSVPESEASEVNIYCKSDSQPEFTRFANIRNLTLSSFDLTGLVASETYTCKALVTVDGSEDSNQNEFTFVPLGQADSIAFSAQPGNAAAGDLLTTQPVVEILDSNGNRVTGGPDSSALITLIISPDSPSIGAVQGTFAVNAVQGVATFSDLNIREAGIKILRAVKSDTSSEVFGTAIMNVDSGTFNITPGNVSAALSSVTIDPAVPPADPLIANGLDAYTVNIALRDEFGNAVQGTTPQFATNIVGDFMIQPFLPTDDNGQTSGSLSTTVADTTPARILNLVSPAGLTSVQVLAPFQPGPASRLAFSRQPTNSPAGELAMAEVRVSVQDAQGNLITTGSDASSVIALAIASNVGGAVLSGTVSKNAVNGEAVFNDLGIDITDTGYRLVASSGALTPAFSNSFNVTAGIPRVIAIFGDDSVLSGDCSDAITIQLQDLGGNPAAALSNTTVQLSGLSNANFYTSSTCGGTPVSSNITFTPGTSTRTYYLRGVPVEQLSILGEDASSVLTDGNFTVNVSPNKMAISALMPSPPAAPGTSLSVPAGQCSSRITITPLADDGTPGPVSESIGVLLNGVVGSQARFYSDPSCTTEIDPGDFELQQNPAPNVETVLYLMDPRGETLNVNVADPDGEITTTSLPQEIIVTASNIDLSGPSTVVAGQCSSAFQIQLLDTLSNLVPTSGNLSLQINGVNGVSTTGQFYTSPACSGAPSNSATIVPDASSSISIYFRGFQAEVLGISIEDPAGNLIESQTIDLTVSPSALTISGPGGVSSDSSECSGPFDIQPLDGVGSVANAVTPIEVNLTGVGIAGGFYVDNDCETLTTAVTIAPGTNVEQVYFLGQYPDTLNLTASDANAVLTAAILPWNVLADWSWLGTSSTLFDDNGDPLGFITGERQVAAAFDGIRGGIQVEMSDDGNYLYVAELNRHRVTKF